MAIQTVYQINPDVGFIGDISTAQRAVRDGLGVPPRADLRDSCNPRPGDAVYWNETNVQFAVPTSAAQQLLVTGILHYRKDDVAGDCFGPGRVRGRRLRRSLHHGHALGEGRQCRPLPEGDRVAGPATTSGISRPRRPPSPACIAIRSSRHRASWPPTPTSSKPASATGGFSSA